MPARLVTADFEITRRLECPRCDSQVFEQDEDDPHATRLRCHICGHVPADEGKEMLMAEEEQMLANWSGGIVTDGLCIDLRSDE